MKKLINIPDKDFKKLKGKAEHNIRSVNSEILIAIRKHVNK